MPKKNTPPVDGEQQGRVLMYCGPAIPGVAAHGMLFTEAPLLEECARECPAIASFLVEPKDYMNVKQQVQCKGSLLHTRHGEVLEYLQGR